MEFNINNYEIARIHFRKDNGNAVYPERFWKHHAYPCRFTLQQGKDSFSWRGIPGELYHAYAPLHSDCWGDDVREAFAHWRLAIFAPSDVEHTRRDTPIVFTFAGIGDDYFKNEKKVFNQFVREVATALEEGRDVVANATHIDKFSRNKLIKAIDARGVKDYEIVCFVVEAPYDTVLKQNNRRIGLKRVPEDAITNMFNKFAMPEFNEDGRITEIFVLRNGKLMRKVKD